MVMIADDLNSAGAFEEMASVPVAAWVIWVAESAYLLVALTVMSVPAWIVISFVDRRLIAAALKMSTLSLSIVTLLPKPSVTVTTFALSSSLTLRPSGVLTSKITSLSSNII